MTQHVGNPTPLGPRTATLVALLAVVAAIGLAVFAFGVWAAFTATGTAG